MTNHEERIEKSKEIHGDDVFVEGGRKGGKFKGLKGMAALKLKNPKKFKEVYKKGRRGRKPKPVDK